ncbi:MAG TPA: ribulose-phosphate 3-epimerase [Clostridiaceae bacterium]|jgi:ribulose-phosphate 3-epimerase|nr:ribulose-phosphate 3-epimerase [Clostridiaceae bacterium]HBF77991.1 ribulose-phosphate 3-epimerase [Clostridiaceae bacterium]HBG39713.1 ribulose-phosphate 3-epimerase [Clostridiaceae bacterium]HBN27465.1 ribulose-phosphate 3-epimerase [Clostridiaceae bacterium]HBX47849.1 ribulose-phosphate 3-epimerase [Clostridiaceae bacterium]
MGIKIAPSLLAADFSNLKEEVKRVENAGADMLHIDIMDGHFVPNLTFGPGIVKSIRACSNLTFDVHLMIENPDLYIKDFALAGADIISVHAEACSHLHRTIQNIKSCGVKAAVALNPATPLQSLEYVLQDLDMVLIMSVNPGFGGQKFIDTSINKVKALKDYITKNNINIDIEVDGGINLNNVKAVYSAGANVIVAGSAIYKSDNIDDAIRQFKSIGD